jgi:hypothetical protein
MACVAGTVDLIAGRTPEGFDGALARKIHETLAGTDQTVGIV